MNSFHLFSEFSEKAIEDKAVREMQTECQRNMAISII